MAATCSRLCCIPNNNVCTETAMFLYNNVCTEQDMFPVYWTLQAVYAVYMGSKFLDITSMRVPLRQP